LGKMLGKVMVAGPNPARGSVKFRLNGRLPEKTSELTFGMSLVFLRSLFSLFG